MGDVTPACGPACEAMPECAVCKQRKAPRGRSVAAEQSNSLCGWDCDGYNRDPRSGHLWPGEIKRASEEAGHG